MMVENEVLVDELTTEEVLAFDAAAFVLFMHQEEKEKYSE